MSPEESKDTGPAPDAAAEGATQDEVREHNLSPLNGGASDPAAAAATAVAKESGEPSNIDLLMDVSVPVVAQLGATEIRIKDVLELLPGSIVELEKLAGEPVDLLVRGQPFAQGEVVVVDENFGVRITKIVTHSKSAPGTPIAAGAQA